MGGGAGRYGPTWICPLRSRGAYLYHNPKGWGVVGVGWEGAGEGGGGSALPLRMKVLTAKVLIIAVVDCVSILFHHPTYYVGFGSPPTINSDIHKTRSHKEGPIIGLEDISSIEQNHQVSAIAITHVSYTYFP